MEKGTLQKAYRHIEAGTPDLALALIESVDLKGLGYEDLLRLSFLYAKLSEFEKLKNTLTQTFLNIKTPEQKTDFYQKLTTLKESFASLEAWREPASSAALFKPAIPSEAPPAPFPSSNPSSMSSFGVTAPSPLTQPTQKTEQVRSALRVSVEHLHVVFVSAHSMFSVIDLSESGVFLQTPDPLPVGLTLEGKVFFPPPKNLQFLCLIEVVRTTPKGTGARVHFSNQQNKEAWTKFIEGLVLEKAQEKLAPQTLTLQKPLLAYFSKEGAYYSGKVFMLSTAQAVFESTALLDEAPVFGITLKIPSTFGTSNCELQGHLIPLENKKYAFRFASLSPAQEQTLQTFLDSQIEHQAKHLQTKEIEEPTEHRELMTFDSLQAFQDRFNREIQGHVLSFPPKKNFRAGDNVKVKISVKDESIENTSHTVYFVFEGKILRITNTQQAVMQIKNLDATTLLRIKKLFSKTSNENLSLLEKIDFQKFARSPWLKGITLGLTVASLLFLTLNLSSFKTNTFSFDPVPQKASLAEVRFLLLKHLNLPQTQIPIEIGGVTALVDLSTATALSYDKTKTMFTLYFDQGKKLYLAKEDLKNLPSPLPKIAKMFY